MAYHLGSTVVYFGIYHYCMLNHNQLKNDLIYDFYSPAFLGSKQPSLTQMLEFGKWAVFKPIGILMQATIIDFNTEDDALESSEAIELTPASTTTTSATLLPNLETPKAPPPAPPPPPPPPCPVAKIDVSDGEPKCKKLSWKELKIDLKNTVWEKVVFVIF